MTLAPYAGGVAALLGDGRVVSTGPADLRTLARGMDGEVLIATLGQEAKAEAVRQQQAAKRAANRQAIRERMVALETHLDHVGHPLFDHKLLILKAEMEWIGGLLKKATGE